MSDEKASLSFQERLQAFQTELANLEKKYQVRLYAANVRLQNDEVLPLMRVIDNLRPETSEPTKQDADRTTKRGAAGKQA